MLAYTPNVFPLTRQSTFRTFTLSCSALKDPFKCISHAIRMESGSLAILHGLDTQDLMSVDLPHPVIKYDVLDLIACFFQLQAVVIYHSSAGSQLTCHSPASWELSGKSCILMIGLARSRNKAIFA